MSCNCPACKESAWGNHEECLYKRIEDLQKLDERTKYVEMTNATLNGKPARITGRLLDYAIVGQIDNPDIRAEFSWDAVRHIMERDGRFKI